MTTLPQLFADDMQQIDKVLRELLKRTEATTALVIDKGGFLIANQGDSQEFDLTTIAALSSGAYMANQTIANLIHETNFNSVYQQGETFSMYVVCIDEHCLLVVVFAARLSVGAVKYFAAPAAQKIADQLQKAKERDPNAGFDLSALNIADTKSLFRNERP
jgi:predicted regulator of Ras-like GTPase activity (Roadblock/LC7/MglB family)